jgi:regulator of protease activity HflC (stomatin/prohibitin superfamily)
MIGKLTKVFGVLGAIIFFVFAGSLFETNDAGYYQVKQAFMTGDMSVRNKAGTYGQWLGDITTYKRTGMHYFSSQEIDGGDSAYAAPVSVTFNGNSKAYISGVLKYRLPGDTKNQLALHENYRSDSQIKEELIRQYVAEVLIQTAPLMTAEEAYAPRKTEFKKIASDQLLHGIYKKKMRTKEVVDFDTNDKGKKIKRVKEVKVVELVLDEDGNPIVETPSPFKTNGIEVLNFTLKDFDFDKKTEELIAKKKETEMLKVLSETDAQKAQQDAIKAVAEGRAHVAKAEAEALVEKKKAVITAERQFEVAKLNRKKAEEEAAAELVKREADAKANALLVKAGLTPRERADIEMKTAIGVAREISKIKLPTTFIGGGGSNNGKAMNPVDAMGIKAYMDLTKELSPKGK